MPIQPRQPRRSKLDQHTAQIVAAADAGIPTREIGARYGVAHSTVRQFLNKIAIYNQPVEQFKLSRADILARLQCKSLALQERIIESYEDANLAELTPTQKSSLLIALNVQAGTNFDKERLERGQSIQNISIISKMIDEQVAGLYKAKPGKPAEPAKPVTQHIVPDPPHNDGNSRTD